MGELAQKLKKKLAAETFPGAPYRIYVHRGIVLEKDYRTSVEEYVRSLGKKDCGEVVYIELQLPGGVWPTDRAEEGAIRPLSCGLVNLGNSMLHAVWDFVACYMNAALQCLQNTRFVKDYITSFQYKPHVNLLNPLGRQGEMVTSFASLVTAASKHREGQRGLARQGPVLLPHRV